MAYFLLSKLKKRKLEENNLHITLYRKGSRSTTMETLHGKHSFSYAASGVLLATSIRKRKEPDEERNYLWWDDGYQNWNDVQFKKRVRVTRETFQFILDSISDQIRKDTTKFKEPTSPDRKLGLTLYRLAHGWSYGTVGYLFGIAPSTACSIFNTVTNVIVQSLHDDLVKLPKNEEEWKKELTSLIED